MKSYARPKARATVVILDCGLSPRGLAHRRTKPRARGPRDRRACDPLGGTGNAICRAGQDLGVPYVNVEDDDGALVGEHVRARAYLVDLSAPVQLRQEVDRLTHRISLPAFRHTCGDVEARSSVFTPNDFLTPTNGCRDGFPAATGESLPQCRGMASAPETTTASLPQEGASDGSMKTFHRETSLRTAGGLTVSDITEEVQEAVSESGVRDGVCCVYSPHTTCSVRVNEYERGFLEDFSVLLRRLVPTEHYYAHDDWDRRTENVSEEDMEASNGHSHCMSMLMGPAGESIPVRDGVLCLGRWQRVLFLELDRERDRRWLVHVVGV